jgi:hypothetical protein
MSPSSFTIGGATSGQNSCGSVGIRQVVINSDPGEVNIPNPSGGIPGDASARSAISRSENTDRPANRLFERCGENTLRSLGNAKLPDPLA